MIEAKSKIHTTRYLATETRFSDLFKAVCYYGYRGDPARVPFYYIRDIGQSAVSDLSIPEEDILAAMKSNTRNEIRRAEREGCQFEIINDIDEFVPFYNAFCDSKGLCDYTSRARMSKFPNLLLTKVVHQENTLAMHANLLDPNEHMASLILSCSQRLDVGVDKKLIGWGNRFLHFKELMYLKSQGYEKYDWSGVVTNPEHPLYSIGQFKLAFGGVLTETLALKSPVYRLLEFARDYVIRFRK